MVPYELNLSLSYIMSNPYPSAVVIVQVVDGGEMLLYLDCDAFYQLGALDIYPPDLSNHLLTP